MNDLVSGAITDGELGLTTTTKKIAEFFGKTHQHVLNAVANLDCSDDFSLTNFRSSDYTTERGKVYKCCEITEKGFYFLVMGFTGKKAAKWKEEFLNEFERLRNGTLSIDAKMTEISKEMNCIKDAGRKWGEIGRAINNRKKKAVFESEKLLNTVQLRLEY